jgi:hypothetical protein
LDAGLAILGDNADRRWFDEEDPYYRFSLLYQFGSFLGWCWIIESQTYLAYGRPSRASRRFQRFFYLPFKGLSGLAYWSAPSRDDDIEERAAPVPRLALTAIGELMVKPETAGGGHEVLTFLEFVRSYRAGGEFRMWFGHVEKLLSDLRRDPKQPSWNRLIVFAAALRALVAHLDERSVRASGDRIGHLDEIDPMVAARVRQEVSGVGLGWLLESAGGSGGHASTPEQSTESGTR